MTDHVRAMNRTTNPNNFLSNEESKQVAEAIARAEAATSAEIRLVVVRHCWGKIEEKAARIFHKLGMHRTKDHNAVLILLVTTNREFLIYGDRGINRLVGFDFWWDVRDVISKQFRKGQFTTGLSDGIEMIGDKLVSYFPISNHDVNELDDKVALDE